MSSAEAEDPEPHHSKIRPGRSQADLRSNRASHAPRARCAGPVALSRYILEALSYLEERGLEHGNLTCSNILIDQCGNVKLCKSPETLCSKIILT